MEKIVKTFKYLIPRGYTEQRGTGELATWTYKGPRYISLEVSAGGQVNAAVPIESWEEYEDLTDNMGSEENTTMLDCEDSGDALIATIFYGNRDSDISDSDVFPHIATTLPNGQVYKRPNPTAPDHTYERNNIRYDVAADEFKKPFPWFKPFMTWNGVNTVNEQSRAIYTETKASDAWADMSADSQAAWNTWDSDTGSIVARMKAKGLQAYMHVPTPFPGMEIWADSAGSAN